MRKFSFLILGILLALLGIHWIASSDSPAPYLWRDGLLLALVGSVLFAANTRPLSQSPNLPLSARLISPNAHSPTLPLFALLIFLLGVFLRLWHIDTAPPDCIGDECTRAMRLLEGNNQSGVVGWLAQMITGAIPGIVNLGESPGEANPGEADIDWPEAGQSALRYAGALIGILTLPTLYLLGRRLGRPLSGLAGMLLLAISPWHIWASRSADPWLAPILGIFLFCWALIGFLRQRSWLDGIFTLLSLSLLVVSLLATSTLSNRVPLLAESMTSPIVMPESPLAAAAAPSAESETGSEPAVSTSDHLWRLLQALIHSDAQQPDSPFATFPWLDGLTAALALAGLATILRWLRQPAAILLALVLLVCGIGVLWGGSGIELLLLPASYLCAVVALAQLIGSFDLNWQGVFSPLALATLTSVALVLPIGTQTRHFFDQLDSLRATAADAVNATIARYLVGQTSLQPNTIFFVPPAVQRDSAARLLAGKLLASDKVQPIEPALLPVSPSTTNGAASDLEFVFPATDNVLIQFLRQVYPAGQFGQEAQDNPDDTLAWLHVPLSAQPGQTMPAIGLNATYYPGEQTQGTAFLQRQEPIPGYPVELDQPYSVLWTGYLAAGRSGEYLLGAVSNGSVAMTVDGMVLFDSLVSNSASLPAAEKVTPDAAQADAIPSYEGAIYLDRGWHPIEIRHTPKTIGASIKFYWQAPGSAPEPLHPLYFLPLSGDPSGFPPPPIPGVADERLGSFDGFALTSSTELWQTQTRILPSNLPVLSTQLVWRSEGGCGAGDGQFNQPHGVAIDATGEHIYVADTGNHRLQRYTLAGKADKSYTNEAFVEPFDLALDSTNQDKTRQLWVLDSGKHAILRIDPESGKVEPFAVPTSFYFPRGIATDSAGNLLVADTGGARVVVLNALGEPLTTFGGVGTVLQAGQPVDVMIQNGIPWAVTAEDGRLWQLNTLGSVGVLQRNNTINGPQLAMLDERGFFASDAARHAILFFSAGGQPRYMIDGEGSFGEPTGIATAQIEGQPYLAVVDSRMCTLSLWRLPEFE